ncbi:MAG TPA: DUF2332 domain-containing protein [Candidatus Baltobacteraceae bacterium]
MHTQSAVPSDLARLGETCAKMGSPFFGALLGYAAHAYETDSVLRDLLERHARRSRPGLRLGGAAHFRALRGLAPEIARHYPSTGGDGDAHAAWQAILRDMHAHASEYDTLFAREVQTNEVARAMPVLAAMLAVADQTHLPLRIFEIGSSAGLVLNFDRYFHCANGWSWGAQRSPVRLTNRITSGVPGHLDADLRIAERHGCDLHPLNAADPNDADTLLGFVWPDQHDRFERLRAALAVAREHPLRIATADGIAWARTAALPADGGVTVLLHTVMVEHLTAEQAARLDETVQTLAAQARPHAPFAWVRMEMVARSYETAVTLWPGAHETLIARSDGHANTLRWTGA